MEGDAVVAEQLEAWKKEGKFLLLPSLVEAELLSLATLQPKDITSIQRFLEESFMFVPCDRTIARAAGSFRRVTKIKMPDAVIGATAVCSRTPLVTRNVRDFKKIPVEIIEI